MSARRDGVRFRLGKPWTTGREAVVATAEETVVAHAIAAGSWAFALFSGLALAVFAAACWIAVLTA